MKHSKSGTIVLSMLVACVLLYVACSKKSTSSPACYDFTLSTMGTGDVSYEPVQTCYNRGDQVFLTATPGEGWAFDRWTGNVEWAAGADRLSNIVITFGTEDISLTAHFGEALSLEVNVEPMFGGDVDIDPDQYYYVEGDEVILEAIPNTGYDFFRWIFDSEFYYDNPIVLTFGSFDEEITAVFAILEGEPDCGDEYEDSYNGGCNSEPPIFSDISDGDIIFGTSGTFSSGGSDTRDTDWYEYDVFQLSELTFTVVPEFAANIYIIYAYDGCDSLLLVDVDSTLFAGDTAQVTAVVDFGEYFLWVGPRAFTGLGCPVEYIAWFEVESVVGAQTTEPRPIAKDLLSNKRNAK